MVSTHKDQVYNTCLGFVHKQTDAEDLSQEVFIEAYTKWDRFRHEASVSTWLYRIAVNKSLEFIRSSQRLKRKGFEVALEDASSIEFEHPGIQLEQKENANILMHHIHQLPEQQQTAFVLSKLEGLNYDEIGKVMHKSKSSVESLLHRAKKQLQNQLKIYYVTNFKS